MDRIIDARTRRRGFLKKAGLTAGVLTLCGFVFVWLAGFLSPGLKRSRIRTTVVEQGPIEAVIGASGTVIPAHEVVLSSPLEARVVKVLKQPGAVLEPGDAILELDVGAAEVELEKLNQKIGEAEGRAGELKLDLEQALIDLDGRREICQLDVEELGYSLAQQKELRNLGLIAEPVYRQADIKLRKAQIELEQIAMKTDNARARTRAKLESLTREIEGLGVERAELESRLIMATTRAQNRGVLTWVADQEGLVVARGEILARIADLESFRVEATASDVHSSLLFPDQPVRVEISGEVLAGRVSSVFPTIENGIVKLLVALEDSSNQLLRSNLRVDVYVVTKRKEEVLKLSKGPAFNGPGIQWAFVIDGEFALRKEVRLGVSGLDEYEVMDGLERGEEVVLSDTRDIEHLAKVRLR